MGTRRATGEPTGHLPVIKKEIAGPTVILDEPHLCIVLDRGRILGSYSQPAIEGDYLFRKIADLHLTIERMEPMEGGGGFALVLEECHHLQKKGGTCWASYHREKHPPALI